MKVCNNLVAKVDLWSNLFFFEGVQYLRFCVSRYRMDPVVWEKKGVSLLAWTVNSKEEKNRFQQVLKIPYMTDHVGLDVSVPEQQQ